METVRSLFLKTRALLDEYSDDGVIIPEADVVDMMMKTIPIADMAQKELHRTGQLFNTFEYANKPAPNLIGLFAGFDIVDFLGEPQYYPSINGKEGAKAYYFEADGVGEARIEERQNGAWTTLATIPLLATTSMTAHKGLINATLTSNPIRLVFDGTTHYRHVNRCLYSYPFASDRIPDYRAWVKVTMPDNFRSTSQIIEESSTRQYKDSIAHKWEGFKDLYVNYYFEGNLRVVYKPVPKTLTAIDDVLEIDDITAQGIVYYVAARLAPFENKELVNFFEQKFGEIKLEATRNGPAKEEQIIDFYGVGV